MDGVSGRCTSVHRVVYISQKVCIRFQFSIYFFPSIFLTTLLLLIITCRTIGFKLRTRTCNNPKPVNTNEGCDGPKHESVLCKDEKVCILYICYCVKIPINGCDRVLLTVIIIYVSMHFVVGKSAE